MAVSPLNISWSNIDVCTKRVSFARVEIALKPYPAYMSAVSKFRGVEKNDALAHANFDSHDVPWL